MIVSGCGRGGIQTRMALGSSSAELQQFERQFREREVDFAGDRRVRYERQLELDAVVARARVRPGQRVLDAGCGIGRISRALARRSAAVTALDFAFPRLLYLRAAAAPAQRSRLQLAQADVTALPFRDASFDLIVCTQVLEHVPDPAGRRALLACFHRLLAPAGRLLLTAYNYSEPWRRRGEPREGRHATGIFYHCYDASELTAELTEFRQVSICGIVNLLPHTYRLWPALGPLGRASDLAVSRARGPSQRWGHLLLADARR